MTAAAWRSLAWWGEVTAWLDARLEAVGATRTGDVEQPHVRPWATVLSAPTTEGRVWLKAAAAETACEIRLYDLLEELAPGYALSPLAVDAARGWVLLPDGGPSLGERLSGDALHDALVAALPRYGELQRRLAPHADRLLAIGLADMRPHTLTARFEDALGAVTAYAQVHGGGEEAATVTRVAALRDEVAAWARRLTAMPGPPSLDHNDLHPWNVLAGTRGEPARFYDWGDAVVAHPFASMLVPLTVARDAGAGDARLRRLRDAYLEPFGDLASHRELVEALELACHAGKVARALTWQRAVRVLDGDAEVRDWGRAPFACMAALLAGSHLGGA